MATSHTGGDPDVTSADEVGEVERVGETDDFGGVVHDEEHLDPPWHDDVPEPTGQRFDAFDASTWDISPEVVPWYETKQAVTTTAVVAVAAVTLVVLVVLLVVRGTSRVDEPTLVEKSTTASSPAPSTPLATAVLAPAPPPPPPPPPPPAAAAPAYVPVTRPTPQDRQVLPTVRVERTSVPPRPGPVVRATP